MKTALAIAGGIVATPFVLAWILVWTVLMLAGILLQEWECPSSAGKDCE